MYIYIERERDIQICNYVRICIIHVYIYLRRHEDVQIKLPIQFCGIFEIVGTIRWPEYWS